MLRASLLLRAALALAAVPWLVLLGLAAAGAVGWGAALLGAAIVLAGAAAAAMVWVREMAHLLRVLAALGGEGPPPGPPLLAATARIAAEISRLARAMTAREAAMAARARAEGELLRLLPDPLLVLGADRVVRRANAAAVALFGPAFGAILRRPALRQAIERALAEGRAQGGSVALPDGLEVAATAVPLPAPLADGGQVLLVLSDRSRERAVERMRADFVANASHELRTPLASLIGFIETLRGPAADDPPAQARFLGIMAEQAQRMSRLIDDLLSLSRIEMTEHSPPDRAVSLPGLVRQQVAALEPLLQRRGTRVGIAIADPLPEVTGDEDQLAQVLQNLLENAVKYGREGGSVRLTVEPAPPAPPLPRRAGVAIRVQDDGPGIAAEHLPRLTERFYRADKHGSRAVGGTGLGLAIVKHIVNRHRGQLAIESAEGRGTLVTIWLPPAPTAAGTGAAGTA